MVRETSTPSGRVAISVSGGELSVPYTPFPDFYAKLEQLEFALSDQYPYYLIARFFQLIGRKN